PEDGLVTMYFHPACHAFSEQRLIPT
ncbi:cyclic nucleotide-binding domain protein, partial [Vibrio parahaemolyticus V-223/04]